MSRNGKNNHYHYAEKYDRRRGRMSAKNMLRLPKRSMIFALIVLLAFGLISTTFASYVSSVDPAENRGSVFVSVRTAKVQQDLINSGAADEIVTTSAKSDVAATGATAMGSTLYLGTGIKDGGKYSSSNWSIEAMTVHSSKYYSYKRLGTLYCKWDNSYQDFAFKVCTNNSWKIDDSTYIHDNFYFQTNNAKTKINNLTPKKSSGGDKDNISFELNSDAYNVYLLAFYPQTTVNNTDYMICCLYTAESTTDLPSFSSSWDLYGVINSTNDSSWAKLSSNIDTTNYSAALNSNASSIIKVYENFNITKSGTTSVETLNYYGNNSSINYANTSRELNTTGGNVQVTATSLGGTHTFSFNSTSKTLSVTYPKYSITASRTPTAAANAPTVSTSSVAPGGSVKLTAADPASSSYEFVNWKITSGSANTGSYASGSSFVSSTNKTITVYPTGSTASLTFVATYKIKEYTITYHSGTNTSGNVANGTKTHDVAYTITSSTYARSGYTQEGWATASGSTTVAYRAGDTYTTNAALDLYPVWSINAPTVSLTDGTLMLDDASSLQLTYQASTTASGITPSKTFTITSYPTGANASNTTITNTGLFTPTVPGYYQVKLSATVTDNATTNRTASNEDTATIAVYPPMPSLSLTVSSSASGDGTVNNPFIIVLGDPCSFRATVSDADPDFTYTWYKGSVADVNKINAVTDSSFTDVNGNGSDITFSLDTALASTTKESLVLYCIASRNDMDSAANHVEIYYDIKNLIDSFVITPSQKIYNVASSASIDVDYEDNFYGDGTNTNASGYTTTVFFSKDSKTYENISSVTDQFMTTFDDVLRRSFFPSGVKYYYMNIRRQIINANSPVVHTTVGTAESSVPSRAFYFINNSGLNFSDYRVMAYWPDSSAQGYGYQTAESLGNNRYRVTIPASVTGVVFAAAFKDSYGYPVVNDGVIDLSDSAATETSFKNFYYAYTPQTAITEEVNTLTISAGSYTDQSVNTDVYHYYELINGTVSSAVTTG